MALNYTKHFPNGAFSGPEQAAPSLPHQGGERLALNTASAEIVGPCELFLNPDEDQWLDIANATADLDPATSPLKLTASVDRCFTLPPGIWYIKATAA